MIRSAKSSPKATTTRSVLALLGLLAVGGLATGAQAELRISFDEGAPKDRFRLENTGACAVADSFVLLDLSTSQGQLIFDVTNAGAGVEVFQPFEIVEGAKALKSMPVVVDGQKEIMFDIAELAPLEAIAFTIDVDDTLGQREITVTGSEIEGARVTIASGGNTQEAVFSEMARAYLSVPALDC